MSSYVGVDLSTHFVDLVKLDEESDRAEWVRVPLVGENAIDRARSYRNRTIDREEWITPRPSRDWWDDVILCALEDPAGRGDTRKIARVQGVVIATIPARVQVWTLQPAEWRKACGLPGNCSKEQVKEWSDAKRTTTDKVTVRNGDRIRVDFSTMEKLVLWPQDACDAYAIAYAARAINQTQEEAA